MNLVEAWEAGNGTAHITFRDIAIIVTFADDHHVHLEFGHERKENYSARAFGLWLKTLGIDPQKGWQPGGTK
jgi:hypothetical protein